MIRIFSIIAILVMSCFAGIAADADKMQSLRKDFAVVAYGFAIDQICDVTPNSEKISYLGDYIDARWWLWRARTGVGKTISKKMAEKAWVSTQAGKNCDAVAQSEVATSLMMLKDFPDRAEALFGTPPKSLLNPKPDQKRIFATYQSARLGWIIAKKCIIDPKMANDLYLGLMDTRKFLLGTFRPDQLAGLEKATSEMKTWGTMGPCSAKRIQFAEMAEGFLADLSATAQVENSQQAGSDETEQAKSLVENNQKS